MAAEPADNEEAPPPAGARSLLRKPLSTPRRLVYALAAVVLPIVDLVIAAQGSMCHLGYGPPGSLRCYTTILLSPQGSWIFFPLVVYSMACLLFSLISDSSLHRPVIRIGLYTGLILTLQYSILFLIDVGADKSLGTYNLLMLAVLTLAPPLFLYVLHVVVRTITDDEQAWLPSAATAVLLGLVFLIPGGGPQLLMPLVLPAPFWGLAIFLSSSIRAWRSCGSKNRFRCAELGGWLAWLSAYAFAWRIAISRVPQIDTLAQHGEVYGHLCYVCTAAARGHRRVVKSEPLLCPDGRVLRVNRQMRYLKCAELLFMQMAPRFHYTCRSVYDVVGPLVARTLAHPLLADLAYVSLKPLEWLAKAGIGALVPNPEILLNRVYLGETSDCVHQEREG